MVIYYLAVPNIRRNIMEEYNRKEKDYSVMLNAKDLTIASLESDIRILENQISDLKEDLRFYEAEYIFRDFTPLVKVAEKYLDILSHSLFYRRWAENERQYLRNDAAIASNPIYAYLRSVRNQSDFLYYYPEMDKMLAILYHQNRNNVMAAWYYQAWTALKKNEADDEETYTGNAHGN